MHVHTNKNKIIMETYPPLWAEEDTQRPASSPWPAYSGRVCDGQMEEKEAKWFEHHEETWNQTCESGEEQPVVNSLPYHLRLW